jgi:uncharacterized membrane protein
VWRLFAHNHWITLKFFGKELRLCARCSGYLSGYLLLKILSFFSTVPSFLKFGISEQLALSTLFSIPAVLDWTTQSCHFRTSNNSTRFVTGTSLGAGVFLLQFGTASFHQKVILYALIIGIMMLAAFLFKKTRLNNYSD